MAGTVVLQYGAPIDAIYNLVLALFHLRHHRILCDRDKLTGLFRLTHRRTTYQSTKTQIADKSIWYRHYDTLVRWFSHVFCQCDKWTALVLGTIAVGSKLEKILRVLVGVLLAARRLWTDQESPG